MSTPDSSAHSGEGKPSDRAIAQALYERADEIGWRDFKAILDRARELERKHEQSEPVGPLVDPAIWPKMMADIEAAKPIDESAFVDVPDVGAPPPSEQAGISDEVRRHAIAIASKATGRAWDQLTTSEVDCAAAALQSAFPRGVGSGEPCPCGLSTCVEPWEPGCGLGNSKEHAVAIHPAPEAQAEAALYATADWQDELRIDGDVIVGPASESFVVPLYLHPQPSTSEKPSASETPSADAERWRALLSCARIRLLGSAGFIPNGESRKVHPEYRHFGAEFWTHHEAGNEPSEAAEVLIQFADAAIAAQRKGES